MVIFELLMKLFFSEKIFLFIAINLKTHALLGYILGHQPASSFYIVELYKKILTNYNVNQNSLIIHSDLKVKYTSSEVQKFFAKENIKISVASGKYHQNQVSESVNDKIKALVILELISKDTRRLRALIKTQPSVFKGKSIISKSRNKDYRKSFFNSDFFQQNAFSAI